MGMADCPEEAGALPATPTEDAKAQHKFRQLKAYTRDLLKSHDRTVQDLEETRAALERCRGDLACERATSEDLARELEERTRDNVERLAAYGRRPADPEHTPPDDDAHHDSSSDVTSLDAGKCELYGELLAARRRWARAERANRQLRDMLRMSSELRHVDVAARRRGSGRDITRALRRLARRGGAGDRDEESDPSDDDFGSDGGGAAPAARSARRAAPDARAAILEGVRANHSWSLDNLDALHGEPPAPPSLKARGDALLDGVFRGLRARHRRSSEPPAKRLPFARGRHQAAAPRAPAPDPARPPPAAPAPDPRRDLAALDAPRLAARVAGIGAAYGAAAPGLESHGCDGKFLASLPHRELDETLADLGFDRLMRRRIYFDLDLDVAPLDAPNKEPG